MDDETRRFVDDDDIVVLVSDGKGDALGLRHGGRGRRRREPDDRPGGGFPRRIHDGFPVDRDPAFADQRLKPAPGQIVPRPRERPVEPVGACAFVEGEGPFGL